MTTGEPMIELKDIKLKLGGQMVHDGINLTIHKGEVIGIVGKSGAGKTTLMREILMLTPPDSGVVEVMGQDLMKATPEEMLKVERQWGVLFQHGALFSSLTLLENIEFPIREQIIKLDAHLRRELALQKLITVGLNVESAFKYPSELSGGMQKRGGLARAIVMDPELLFLDEPTSGLDPESAAELDELIINLQQALGLTVVIVTHDLDTLWRVTNRVAFLSEGKILCVEPMEKLVQNKDEVLQNFFNGPRGRTAKKNMGE
jgi:phospholipid/cholesterol/gamma-HCH transport system ATP-binding protein